MKITKIEIEGMRTVEEAAKILGISACRVGQFCREGRLPCCQFKGRRLVSLENIMHFHRIERTTGHPKRLRVLPDVLASSF